jgi:RNA polymerase sigma factor (TIGR02999 family)
MSRPAAREVTRVLQALKAGEPDAAERLLALAYHELHWLARARMAREKSGATLQPTALVHEAYLRLFAGESPRWENRAHFFVAAAEAMRRILIERARRRARLKRGGGDERVTLRGDLAGPDPTPETLVALDEALGRLAARDPTMSRVVELRFFAGLTVAESAEAMGCSPRTVNRLWVAARAWLQRELTRGTRQKKADRGAR